MEEITIIEVPDQQVLGINRTGRYQLIPELLLKTYEYIEGAKIAIAGMPMFICHETCPEAVYEANEKGTALVEVVWPVSGMIQERGDIKAYILTGGKMARIIHKGPYETCESTYLRLFSWIGEQNLTIRGPIREVYHNDPRMVRPEDIITEIQVPVT